MFFLTEGSTTPAGGFLPMLLMLGVTLAIFYFMMIRPENKRKKEAEAMRNALKPGDRITTIGGIIGTVVNVKEDKIVIETSADQVRIEFAKWALSTNDSANERAAEEKKKEQEAREKAIAAKRAEIAEKKAAKKNKKK